MTDTAENAPTVLDPVCGMTVDPEKTRHHYRYGDTVAHFCSAGCRAKFSAYPEVYLRGEKPPTPDAGGTYTCPMHPEVVSDGPADCPICGMALEPAGVSFDEKPNPELVDMTRRAWVSGIFLVPLLVLAMGGHMPGVDIAGIVPPTVDPWIQFALALPIVLWGCRFSSGAGRRLCAGSSTCSR